MRKIILTAILWSLICLSGCSFIDNGESDGQKDEYAVHTIAMSHKETKNAVDKVKEFAKCCSDIYMASDKGNTLNVILDEETVHNMAEYAAKSGLAVTCAGHDYNFLNYEQVDDALRKMQNKKNAMTEFYVIDNSGTFHYYNLQYEKQKLTVITADAIIDQQNEIRIRLKEKYEPYGFQYTQKGWLILEKALSRNAEMDMHIIYRIRPLDEQCREACQRYIMPVNYLSNNLFLTDWDTDSMERIVFNDLFDKLYSMRYKKSPDIREYEDGIPKEEFEETVAVFFNISPEKLQEYAQFDVDNQRYLWQPVDEWNRVQQNQPFPEVTELRRREDGMIILTVEAVLKEMGTDCSFRHEVFIKEEGGQWKYAGNKISDEKEWNIPLYKPRNSAAF